MVLQALLIKSFSIACSTGIQAFAKFKRPEYTKLHLRELQSNKFFLRSTRNSLNKSVLFAVLVGAIAAILPLYTMEIKNAPSALLSYISTREFLRTREK